MPKEDGDDGDPDNPAVNAVVRAVEDSQVADQEGNLEEADAQLVDRTAGIVCPRVWD